MSSFTRLRELEEEYVHILENRLTDFNQVPWSKVIKPEFISQDDAYTLIQDEPEGILPVVGKGESLKALTIPGETFKQPFTKTVGAKVVFTTSEIKEKSNPKILDGTTIVLRKRPGETLGSMQARGTRFLIQLLFNTVLKVHGEFFQGSITLGDDTWNTNVTDGGAVGTLWSNYAAATPIGDMEAIDIALEALSGNYGRTLEFGHTIMSRQVIRHLLQVEQIQRLPWGDALKKINSKNELKDLAVINEYFGQIIDQNLMYKNAGSYIKALEADHIYCTSGTQLDGQHVAKIALMPGGIHEQFDNTRGARGFGLVTNTVPAREIGEDTRYEIGLETTILLQQYSPIYKKQVI